MFPKILSLFYSSYLIPFDTIIRLFLSAIEYIIISKYIIYKYFSNKSSFEIGTGLGKVINISDGMTLD